MRNFRFPRSILVAATLVGTTALAGCGGLDDAPAEYDPGSIIDHSGNSDAETADPLNSPIPLRERGYGFTEHKVLLNDGRTVTCLSHAGHREDSISCDWEHAGAPRDDE